MSKKEKKNDNSELIIKNIKKGILLIIIGTLIVTLFNLEYLFARANLNKILDTNNFNKDTYVPEGILRITSEYKGDISSYKIILKSIEDVAKNVIPKYKEVANNKSDEELTTYFDKHAKVILMETGIETVEEFIKFAKHLNALQGENFVIQDYYVDITTIIVKYNRVETNMIFEYENGQSIALNLVLKNITQKNVSPIKYIAP